MADHRDLPARLSRFLLLAIAAFWAAYALLLLTGVVSIGAMQESVAVFIAVLMLGNATAMGLLARLVLGGRRLFDYAAIAVVAANVLLTVTDEVGAYDLAYLGVTIVTVALLVWSMRGERVRP